MATDDYLALLEAEHVPHVGYPGTRRYCGVCEAPWPCDASKAVAALRAVEAIPTTPVSDRMDPAEIDQAEGWNDAIRQVRAAIESALTEGDERG